MLDNLNMLLKFKNKKEKGGAALYFTFLIMIIFTTIAISMSTTFFRQLRILGDVGYSVTAFYAADSGIERILNHWGNLNFLDNNFWNINHPVGTDAFYACRRTEPIINENRCIRNITCTGTRGQINRAIEVIHVTTLPQGVFVCP